jgi:hypothetical protein
MTRPTSKPPSLGQLEAFVLELGRGFAFVERQKRMVIDGEDFYLDLLFFHRRLRRLVAIELKLGRFKAGHKGQMELYLAWLNQHERQPGEEPPIGLILCAEASREQVELLQMQQDGITVAEYWTELPPKAELAAAVAPSLARGPGAAWRGVGCWTMARMRMGLTARRILCPGKDPDSGCLASAKAHLSLALAAWMQALIHFLNRVICLANLTRSSAAGDIWQ